MSEDYEFKVDIRGRYRLRWISDVKVKIIDGKLIIKNKTYRYRGINYFLDFTKDISGTYNISDIISIKFRYKLLFAKFIVGFTMFTIIACIYTYEYLFLLAAVIGILSCTIKNIKITFKNKSIIIPINHILKNNSIEYKQKINEFMKALDLKVTN